MRYDAVSALTFRQTLNHTGSKQGQLGTFFGVFLPCVLTILGVILYIRLGWITGHLGLFKIWLLITLATSITFITGLSVATLATNMRVGGGGSYFMISRALGLEAGAAIGLPLFVGKALGVAFYIVGFAESLQIFMPETGLAYIGTVVLLLLTAVALFSTDLAARSQLVVFVMIVISLLALVFSQPIVSPPDLPAASLEALTFWAAFAIFFPAVTGIEAGVGLSGNLKKPGVSLPLGVIAAVAASYMIYMAVPWLMLQLAEPELLRSDPLIMRELVPHTAYFYCGLWGAALSSALVSLLAAPRTLQQLARDGVVPAFLGRGASRDDTPRTATLLTFSIALAGVWLGGLNDIAKALSMFFLTTYGLLNLAAALEGILDNPSWRPTFRVSWWISLAGAVISFTVMFFLDVVAASVATMVGFGIYFWMHKRHLNRRWEDVRTGLWLFLTRTLLYRLRDYVPGLENWRPHLLVFTGAPTRHWHLVELAEALSHKRGILTLATMIPDSASEENAELLEQSLNQVFEKHHVTALTRVHRTPHLLTGMRHMIEYYGVGPLKPNTIMLSHTEHLDHRHDFAELIIQTCREERNLILTRESRRHLDIPSARQIDIWWSGNKRKLGFMLAIAYLMQHSPRWSDTEIRIHIVLHPGQPHEPLEANLNQLLANDRLEARLTTWDSSPEQSLFDHIRRVSGESEVVIMGMRAPGDNEPLDTYADYYGHLRDQLPDSPLSILVLPVEDLPFMDLFR